MKCLGTILAIAFLTPILSRGQIKISADTLCGNCRYIASLKTNKIIIDSQEKYDQAEFVNNFDERCVPFEEIDFDKSILVGVKYRGSNCDSGIQWSTIEETEKGYLIQFATSPNHVCRDLSYPIAWFVVDKPSGKVDITFERVAKKDSR
jgi:hypothetical protein